MSFGGYPQFTVLRASKLASSRYPETYLLSIGNYSGITLFSLVNPCTERKIILYLMNDTVLFTITSVIYSTVIGIIKAPYVNLNI